MSMFFCTLFDTKYMDKGLALYNSLEKECSSFRLFILPMDERCGEILEDMQLKSATVIDFKDFMNDSLEEARNNRSAGEFCWTCTPFLVDYCLNKYDINMVTYVDSDIYFYSDPQVLIDEMLSDNASVQILRHNFMQREYKEYVKMSGEYCVQFNTFLNNSDSREVLKKWKEDCISCCSYSGVEGVLGDQKYLEEWPDRYTCINISKNLGAGIAPWNTARFRYFEKQNGKKYICDFETKKEYPVIFFHFQSLIQVENGKYYCCKARRSQIGKLRPIYRDYIFSLIDINSFLFEKYNVKNNIRIHPVIQERTGEDSISGSSIFNNIKNLIISIINGNIIFKELYIKVSVNE